MDKEIYDRHLQRIIAEQKEKVQQKQATIDLIERLSNIIEDDEPIYRTKMDLFELDNKNLLETFSKVLEIKAESKNGMDRELISLAGRTMKAALKAKEEDTASSFLLSGLSSLALGASLSSDETMKHKVLTFVRSTTGRFK